MCAGAQSLKALVCANSSGFRYDAKGDGKPQTKDPLEASLWNQLVLQLTDDIGPNGQDGHHGWSVTIWTDTTLSRIKHGYAAR